jgi:hypothetical protein
MKTFTSALLIALLGVSQLANAGTKSVSASFQTTFVIAEACAVNSSAKEPVVNCQFNTPFQAQHADKNGNATHIDTVSSQDNVMTVTF